MPQWVATAPVVLSKAARALSGTVTTYPRVLAWRKRGIVQECKDSTDWWHYDDISCARPSGSPLFMAPSATPCGLAPESNSTGQDPRLERCGRGASQSLRHPVPTGWRCLGRGEELAAGTPGTGRSWRPPRIRSFRATAPAGEAPPAQHPAAAHPGPYQLAVGLAPPAVLRLASRQLPPPHASAGLHYRVCSRACSGCCGLPHTSARYSTETLSRRCRLQLLIYGLPQPQRQPPTGLLAGLPPRTACAPSDRNRAAPRQFELTARRHAPALAAACSAAAAVRQAGFPTPLWGESSACCTGAAPRQAAEETLRRWQRAAASACDERAFETHLSQLDPPPAGEACVAGEAPELHEIFGDVRPLALTISRLPAPTSHAA